MQVMRADAKVAETIGKVVGATVLRQIARELDVLRRSMVAG